MDSRSTGLILRLRPLTESSLIVHWITRDLGRVATVAKGARRPHSPFRGKLDLYFLADLSLRPSRSSDLHTLLELRLLEVHPGLRQDWIRLQHAAYAANLLELSTETNTPIPELFELLAGFVGHLSNAPASAAAFLSFELKTLQLLGFAPSPSEDSLSPLHRQTLRALGRLDWPELDRLPCAPDQLRPLAGFLQAALAASLPRLPKARATALSTVIG